MEGAEETWRVNGVTRDLMKRSHFSDENVDDDDDGEVELSLGLSMNGRFGVDRSSKKLRRSSSLIFPAADCGGGGGIGGSNHAHAAAREGHAPLARTCSLPAETEEWRLGKDLQSEARKKRMEKLKNVRVGKEHESSNNNNNSSSEDDVNGNVNWNFVQSPQGSIGSSGAGGSSGVPNFQTQLMIGEGSQNPVIRSSSASLHNNPPLEQGGGRAAPAPAPAPRAGGANGNDELVKNALLDMPYVSTRGFAPHFNKIEGFLYRYKKGEDVKIVCVCHGLFLSPAEFVKHGGGGDVAQPLKHIVVNPFPLF